MDTGDRAVQFDFQFALEILPAILRGAVITIEATLGGMALALVGGLVLALLRRSPSKPVSMAANAFIQFMRMTPLLVQLYFVFYVLPLFGVTFGPLVTGVIGLGANYSAYIAEVYRAGIQSVPAGQWEASTALGFSNRHVWTRIILPQAIPPMLPVLGNYLVGMFKDTPLLATIAVSEMFGAAQQIAGENYRYNEAYTLVGLGFLIMSIPASLLFRRFEKHDKTSQTLFR
jgi:polar amino acid transport system permease protein